MEKPLYQAPAMDMRLSDAELFEKHCFKDHKMASLGDLWADVPLLQLFA